MLPIPPNFNPAKYGNTPDGIRRASKDFGVSSGMVRKWLYAKSKPDPKSYQAENPFEVKLPKENPFEQSPLKRHDESMVIEGDTLVIFDLHIPEHDADLLFKACKLAKRYGVKNVLFGGDMLSCGMWNPKHVLKEKRLFQDDIDILNRILETMTEEFGLTCYAILGNHEGWFTKSTPHIWKPEWIFEKLADRLTVVSKEWCDIESGDVLVRAEHGCAYSAANPLGPVQKLSAKFQRSVISGHQHLAAVGFSTCGRFQCISSGGMFDPARIAYANEVHRPSPVMQQGFVVVKDGWCSHHSPLDPELAGL